VIINTDHELQATILTQNYLIPKSVPSPPYPQHAPPGFFEVGYQNVTLAGLELVILLLPPPKCWDYGPEPASSAPKSIFLTTKYHVYKTAFAIY
jgi:hypothetical protein